MSLQRQAVCHHTRLTCAGSNQFQSRVTCCECRKVLVLLYHSVPETYVQHGMEQRHRWLASRIDDLEHFSWRAFIACDGSAPGSASASGPEQPAPGSASAAAQQASEPKARANPAVRVARGTIQHRAHSDPPASQRHAPGSAVGSQRSAAPDLFSTRTLRQQPAAPGQQPAAPGQQPAPGTSQQPAAPGQQPAAPAAASGAHFFVGSIFAGSGVWLGTPCDSFSNARNQPGGPPAPAPPPL